MTTLREAEQAVLEAAISWEGGAEDDRLAAAVAVLRWVRREGTPLPSPSRLARFADGIANGLDPDEAAQRAGGTGRP